MYLNVCGLRVYRSVLPDYAALLSHLSSGPLMALMITPNNPMDDTPIWVSQTLNKTQGNCSTIEEEYIAIVEALRKLEYLTRDVHFTLHRGVNNV